jgi:uncharacterized repeat protein (TIGR03803 family)
MSNAGTHRRAWFVGYIFAALIGATVAPGSAAAATEKVLYSFCQNSTCPDGSVPYAPLLMDGSGVFYGTAYGGGANASGVVFRLTKSGTNWVYDVLYDFCAQSSCTDGSFPGAGLIMDDAGKLYGTTNFGGTHNGGTVFRLSPTNTGWTHSILHNFCFASNCAGGTFPTGPLMMDAAGDIYGTTYGGGLHNAGTAYRLSHTNTGWQETVLHNFCARTNCNDGSTPLGGLIMDGSGNLYGTAVAGANTNNLCPNGGTCGVVFQLTHGSTGWTEHVLHAFCAQATCGGGGSPFGGLIMDGAGNLYGTAWTLGANGFGTVFKMSHTSAGWTYNVLHSFNYFNGANPHDSLIRDGAGKIYGMAVGGGTHSNGVVFELSSGGQETVLHNFCTQTGCPDGSTPYGGLVMDGAGNFYGTTSKGGNSIGGGVVFKLTP